MRKLLQWVLIGFSAVILLGTLVSSDFGAALCIALAIAIILPFTKPLIEQKAPFLKSAFARVAVWGVLLFIMAPAVSNSPPTRDQVVKPEITASPVSSPSVAPVQPSPSPIPTPSYVRSTVADNGSPIPSTSGYIEGYPKEFTNGYSTVTIDNAESNSDILVKLFSLDTTPATAVRVFFVRANDTFTIESVRPGKYDVRYQNLDSGALARTESFELEETETAEGVRFTRLTLSLYLVQGGNLETYPVSEEEF